MASQDHEEWQPRGVTFVQQWNDHGYWVVTVVPLQEFVWRATYDGLVGSRCIANAETGQLEK